MVALARSSSRFHAASSSLLSTFARNSVMAGVADFSVVPAFIAVITTPGLLSRMSTNTASAPPALIYGILMSKMPGITAATPAQARAIIITKTQRWKSSRSGTLITSVRMAVTKITPNTNASRTLMSTLPLIHATHHCPGRPGTTGQHARANGDSAASRRRCFLQPA